MCNLSRILSRRSERVALPQSLSDTPTPPPTLTSIPHTISLIKARVLLREGRLLSPATLACSLFLCLEPAKSSRAAQPKNDRA